MFVPELWQTHNEYKTLVNGYWKSNKSQISNLYAKEHQVLLDLNLDVLPNYISQFYSSTGRPAKTSHRSFARVFFSISSSTKSKKNQPRFRSSGCPSKLHSAYRSCGLHLPRKTTSARLLL